MTVDVKPTTHPFLDGRPKRMLIDGKWVEAASGKTFATINPATGEVLAQGSPDEVTNDPRVIKAYLGSAA